MKRYLTLMLCTAIGAAVFTSCDDDETIETYDFKTTPYAYFLCEGNWGQNNASISYMTLNDKDELTLHPDLYASANGRELGDLANDLLYYDGSLYVVVSGSRYIARLDETGHELARHTFSEEDGDPRHIVVDGKSLFATLYGGTVARLDLNSLQTVQSYAVGERPEELAFVGDRLLVCNTNYGAGNTLSSINLTTGAVETIETAFNPTEITRAGSGDIAFFKTTSYDAAWNATNTIWRIDATRGFAIDSITSASYILPLDSYSVLFLDQSVDYSTTPATYRNAFRRLDLASGNMTELAKPFALDMSAAPIYMMSVDWRDGDIYIATAEADASGSPLNSKLYCFNYLGGTLGTWDDAGGMFMSKGVYHPVLK